jgi:hypothetical protein
MYEIRGIIFPAIVIILFICLASSNNTIAQIGLQTPTYKATLHSDTSNVRFPQPVLPLRDWYDRSDSYFRLKHEISELDISRYISVDNIVPSDPFKLDMRGSSYYVPRMVRDELNLIMNRPRESAFVPILPAAFLTLQLASKYLLVQKKTEITVQDVENAKEGYPILKELWKKNPQTLSELYKINHFNNDYTMLELQKIIDLLVDNKLVKRKLMEKSETLYFYALEEFQYNQLLEKGKFEEQLSPGKPESPAVEIDPDL